MGGTMTQGEAKMRILAEWRTWVGHRQLPDSNTNEDASVFFGEIEQNHPDLLSFETSEDKRQLVSRWLVDAGLIKY
jgi:hypothetical protein